MNRISSISLRAAVGVVTVGAFAVAVVQSAGAQSAPATDARWQPWIGCWQPAGPAPLTFGNETAASALVCVVPAGGSAVDVATIVDGKVAARERVDAGGKQVASTQDGCEGWRSGRWSPDGRRVYLRSQYSCSGSARRESSGLLAISAAGELLDVEGVGVDRHRAVRTLRYRPAPVPASLATELAADVTTLRGGGTAARLSAGAPVSLDDVREVAQAVDAKVLEAWLVERGQAFEIDARELVALADAGVPGSTIDVLVAVSYPKVFAVNRGGMQSSARDASDEPPSVYGTLRPTNGIGSDYYGWNGYSPFGQYPYGYGYGGYEYGYGGYNYGGGWYAPTGPIIIVKNPDGSLPEAHGRVVKGGGYTRNDGSSGGSGGSTPRDRTPSSNGSGGSTAGAAPSSPPPASAGAESSGRSAKPRP